MFVVRCKNRESLNKYLENHNIQTNIHYPIAPHKQGAYSEWNNQTFPITEEIHRTIMSLPMSPVMRDDEVKIVVDLVNKFKSKSR